MGSIRMPTIPGLASGFTRKDLPRVTKEAAAEALAELFARRNTLVVTGAGVSVDSGIRAYRGKIGFWRMLLWRSD